MNVNDVKQLFESFGDAADNIFEINVQNVLKQAYDTSVASSDKTTQHNIIAGLRHVGTKFNGTAKSRAAALSGILTNSNLFNSLDKASNSSLKTIALIIAGAGALGGTIYAAYAGIKFLTKKTSTSQNFDNYTPRVPSTQKANLK